MSTEETWSENASMEVASSVSSRSTNEADNFTYSHKRMVKELVILLCVEELDFGLSEKFAFMRFAVMASCRPHILAYSHEMMVREVTRLIFTEGFQVNLGQSVFFVQFVRKALNPNYRAVKTKEVVNEAKKELKHMKKVLLSTFSSLSHKFSLAYDVWRNEDGVSYIRITAHWIDDNWCMHRRIINFKEIYSPFCAANVFDPIKKSIDLWEISDKISSVTVDDVIDDDEAMEELKNYVQPILDGKLFRHRCVCRVLNSCILDNEDLVNVHIEKIRKVSGFPFTDRERYTFLCEKYGLEPKFDFPWTDMIGWDDTREMLKRNVHYKDVVNEYISICGPNSKYEEINDQDWEVVSVYIRFLDVFYEAVDFVSHNYYPSSSGVLIHLVNIAKLFSEYRGSFIFEEKFWVMEEKFLKYFRRIPDLFCLAAVMDPRIKLSGCECLLESYYRFINNIEVNVEQEKIKLSNLLYEMFNEYASKICPLEQPSSLSTSGFAWSLLSQKRQKTSDSVFNELAFYLKAPIVFEKETGDFDILGWWKTHELVYPVLADMARDILTTAVSTLAPDCAFVRIEERKIMDRSYHYRWGLLELYTRSRDWFNAEMRTQGKRYPVLYDDDDDGGGDDDDEW